MNNRLINTKVAAAGCTDIVDNYDPFGGGFALYQLNGNADDVSGNYNGTASNVTYGTGVFGQAGVFNGSSSYIDLGSIILGGTNNITLSMWVNPASSQGTYATIFDNEHENIGGFVIYQDGDNVNSYSLGWENSSGTFIKSSNFSLTANSWSFLTVTIDSLGNYRIYVNAANVISGSGLTALNTTISNPVKIGRYSALSIRYFNGSIDQVRIFNTALDPLEVEALYTEEYCICGGTVDTLNILGDNSCIATYTLDGNANDLSGNYSGTPTNVSYGVGEFDLAGVFNGTSSYINTNLSLPFNGVKTISMWFKANSLQNAVLFEAGPNIPYYGYSLVTVNDGRFYFIINNSNHSGFIGDYTTGATYTTGVWYNVVSTMDGNTQKTYLNGSEIGSLSYSTTSESYSIYLAGGSPSGFSGLLNGSIDQVRIFNKALNSTEVTTLYNETACANTTREAGATQILGDNSCVAYYKLDGTADDETGTYDGTFTNADYGNGEFDLAGNFNGIDKRINISNTILNFSNAHTISFWFNPKSLSSLQGLFSHYTTYHTTIFLEPSGSINFVGTIFSGTTVSINSWNNIIAINAGGTLTYDLYLNGSFLGSADTFAFNGRPTTIGAAGSTPSTYALYFNGLIDQIRLFNKAVSSSEVTTLYNEGL